NADTEMKAAKKTADITKETTEQPLTSLSFSVPSDYGNVYSLFSILHLSVSIFAYVNPVLINIVRIRFNFFIVILSICKN
ncbi:hypothetical protein Tco_0612088, partial [Tanacetum coccineum]